MELIVLFAGFVVLINVDQRRHPWVTPILRIIGIGMSLGCFALLHHIWTDVPVYPQPNDDTIKWVLLVGVGFMTFLFVLLAVWPQGLQKDEPRVSRHIPPQ